MATNNHPAKIRFDGVRIDRDTVLKLEILCADMGVTKSFLVQTILDAEVDKYVLFFAKDKEYINEICTDKKKRQKL